METFKPISKEASKWNLKGRNVLLNVAKKEKDDDEWWPRLTKDKAKNQNIQIDWARWTDPDDSGDEKKDPGMGDMDPSMMNAMGGGGGMPGMGDMGGPGGPGGGMDMAAMMEQMKAMGMDPSKMGGAEGMGGMQGNDSDDEEGEES